MRQLVKFGLVGGTGVVINLVVIIVCNKLGPDPHGIAVNLPWSRFNIRTYHVYATIAFLVANLWNFQLNRWWTFRTSKHAAWLTEYWPFLLTGLVALVGNLAVLTALLHPNSPISLPHGYFDDTTGLRNRLYWGQLIAVVVVTPVTFLVNKYWTFTAGTVSAAAAAAELSSEGADESRSPATPAP
ncbi:GtrA family protein [Nocardioides marmorisolisilvae]|uniref:GtrA family protein n=2 Tax=Nocardioides marmorisolisilvae TaxID=1542737 RepID=A0A3N0DXT8_9ACTN|nr:GtrA family protein [Nocardioides marmorisolisilvae]